MYKYEIANGKKGSININEPLIDRDTVANARANAEFLNNGYTKRYIEFVTYKTNIKIYDIISVKGNSYRVISVTLNMNDKQITSTVKAVRYEI